MSGSKLKLNPDKTEFRRIGYKRFILKYCPIITSRPGICQNLGVVFNSSLTFKKHGPIFVAYSRVEMKRALLICENCRRRTRILSIYGKEGDTL